MLIGFSATDTKRHKMGMYDSKENNPFSRFLVNMTPAFRKFKLSLVTSLQSKLKEIAACDIVLR